MKKTKKIWLPVSPKKQKFIPTEFEKKQVEAKFSPLIDKWKKTHIGEPHPEFNYRTDFYTKWYRMYFYLCGKYESKSPNRMVDSFEDKFVRLEYKGKDNFNISYMRHTGQWWPVFENQTLEQCYELIETEPFLQPV